MRKTNFHPIFLKAICLWLAALCAVSESRSQVTNISGIVNSYYSVIEVPPVPACVRVNTVAGLSGVNKVLLVQMKGAIINTSSATSSNWGDTTTLAQAGNYEFAYICSIRGDTVFFVHNLLNSYSPVTGKMQLVTVAEYPNANVTDTLKAKAWNNTTGTGGVIAIDVIDTLTLNAPIYADSSGFRGGAFFQHSGNCDFFNPAGAAYAYDANNFSSGNNGAHKGEGVADVAATVDGAKGAPANGGGGGNNHNNSGGGGANLATGGRGGGNSSTGPTFCITSNNMGYGGKALQNWSGRKIFSGGGGGAGHNNNAVFMLGGGNGGGIIFIHADTLISNGYRISANGGAGGQSQGDGAGGGGGGGTIIMDVNTYLDAATIRANGGNGGNSDDVGTPGRCFGGGGGGSGGVIYFRVGAPAGTTTPAGGGGGSESNRDGACNPAIPGAVGTDGQLIINYTYRIGSVFAGSCGVILPAKLVYFKATPSGKNVVLSWKMLNPELADHYIIERLNNSGQWEQLGRVNGIDNAELYSFTDLLPNQGDNFYRIRIEEKNNAISWSPTRYVFLGSKDAFRIYPNPASGNITITGSFNEPVPMRLFDITGKMVFSKTLLQYSNNITLPQLPKGVYMLRVNEITRKLIIH